MHFSYKRIQQAHPDWDEWQICKECVRHRYKTFGHNRLEHVLAWLDCNPEIDLADLCLHLLLTETNTNPLHPLVSTAEYVILDTLRRRGWSPPQYSNRSAPTASA